jgi:hypothetical protein
MLGAGRLGRFAPHAAGWLVPAWRYLKREIDSPGTRETKSEVRIPAPTAIASARPETSWSKREAIRINTRFRGVLDVWVSGREPETEDSGLNSSLRARLSLQPSWAVRIAERRPQRSCHFRLSVLFIHPADPKLLAVFPQVEIEPCTFDNAFVGTHETNWLFLALNHSRITQGRSKYSSTPHPDSPDTRPNPPRKTLHRVDR